MHEKNAFIWTDAHQNCFESLKNKIVNAPVLANYRTDRLTRIRADASCFGIGGALEKMQDKGM